ncbi:GNAT family N-acetyltransferase [Adhaeribacter arboris]|uniref:GNAT family N-acetyltransferase n=1 Tax=Adhaeribacter arboris TaxID=2072846 RepID=A0A2T2YAQ1_9BACT|nr:GNAT family protein [Adhaeribacter arboris]PSR52518.1 GNAT family N-acetyltransferase [Adhaeribacter arboris]
MDFSTFFPPNITLETDKVKLRILQPTDTVNFHPLTQDKELWRYFTKELNELPQLKAWVEEAETDYASARRVPFTIIQKETGLVCGSTSYGNISFYDKRLEIGWSWLGATFRGTQINRHCKFALLQYAFETMQMERVEIKTDNLNERAKAALVKIGATAEGVLRSHMLMPGGRRRDSIYFSIIKTEWLAIRQTIFADVAPVKVCFES